MPDNVLYYPSGDAAMSVALLVPILFPIGSVVWVDSCDAEVCGAAEWASQVWTTVLGPVNGGGGYPVTVRVGSVGGAPDLARYDGCDSTCRVVIDPRGLPGLGRVAMLQAFGHVLGFRSGIPTPYAAIASEFGDRSGLWIEGSHWGAGGAAVEHDLVMSALLSDTSYLSYSAVYAVATYQKTSYDACGSSGDCGSDEVCSSRAWPYPGSCVPSASIDLVVLLIVCSAASSFSLVLIMQ